MTNPGVARTPITKEPPRPLKQKPQKPWMKRRKEYLLANGRLDQYDREFGHA